MTKRARKTSDKIYLRLMSEIESLKANLLEQTKMADWCQDQTWKAVNERDEMAQKLRFAQTEISQLKETAVSVSHSGEKDPPRIHALKEKLADKLRNWANKLNPESEW